jgi:class 3 adenylate cyclase
VAGRRAFVDRGITDHRGGSREAAAAATTRRLAAILAADVAGYSRLMGADEEGTLNRLKAHRRELVDPKIREHHGRIVKTTGDGMLVEFSSVADAVRCAVEIQRAMADRSAEVPEDKRITFRIGVNLGDVIADGGDIYGDGSTSPRAWRLRRSLAASASRARCAIMSVTGSLMPSMTSENKALRTSRSRCTPSS